MNKFIVSVADASHQYLSEEICDMIAESAKQRGTGIAKRSPDYISQKIASGQAVIALSTKSELAGFCYIETWGHGKYVANSGLIVHSNFRKHGLAQAIKERAFKLSRKLYPQAKLFGLTTSHAVMKINSDLGYRPVPFSELTDDQVFWSGCSSCVNYDILTSKNHQNCLCTGMIYDPSEKKRKWEKKRKEVAEKLMIWKKTVKTK
ncbi:MAG: GNAT family N-acetyltransferase [Cyclobacteriaceae bacterium]